MDGIDELSQAIAALDARRAELGDQVVEAALAPLREKLALLELVQPVSRQRRLVTMLFLDIVNSTQMSLGREPEEILEIMGGALRRLSKPIRAYGGNVTQYMGDGFVAVFGFSGVHENDARQAVRAGLDILAEAQACALDLENRYQVQGFDVRLGVNTGRVVAGRFTEAESTIMGITVSLAARMEQAAMPGTLLISQFTHQHVRGAFDFEPLAPVTAKGFPQPVGVYRVLSARPRTFRTLSRGVEGIETSLIGRRKELSRLKSALTRTISSRQPHFVLILGDAGVGKSRLLYEFDNWIAHRSSPVTAFKAHASPEITSEPFRLLRSMVSYHLGLLTTDPAETIRNRLEQALSDQLVDEPMMKAHFIGSLLGFDFSGSSYLQGVEGDPRQLSRRAKLYLGEFIRTLAHQATTILMLDDIHWADAPSLAFITNLVREGDDLPLLVICLARNDPADRFPGWSSKQPPDDPVIPVLPPPGSFIRLVLNPLPREACQELVDEILRNVEDFPQATRDRILDSADGNPFYIEEYIQSLVDATAISRQPAGRPWKVDPGRLGSLPLPGTLVALLESRLDSLDTAHRVLVEQASVIGTIFWSSALQAVHGDKLITDADLQALVGRGFINPYEVSTFAGTQEFHFHHGLLREVAYQTLLKPDRQVYHEQAAAWLIDATQASGRVGEFAPTIAGHYESAGKQVLAVDWYTQAGMRARNQGAPAHACTFFDRALALMPLTFDSHTPAQELNRRWQALAGRDEVLGILGDTNRRMVDDASLVELAEMMADDHLRADAYSRQGYYLGMSGKYPQELEAYNCGLAAARRVHDQRKEAIILGLKTVCEVRLGEMEAASRTARDALACAEMGNDEMALVLTLGNVATYYTEKGDMARAAQLIDRMLEINRRAGNLQDEVAGLSNLGYTYIQLGVPAEGIRALRRCIEMAQAVGNRKICAYGSLNLALAYVRGDEPGAAQAELARCLPELREMGDAFGYAVGQTYNALAGEKAGKMEEAQAGFEQAQAALWEIGVPGSAHDALAGVVRCLLVRGDTELARQNVVALWDYLQHQSGTGMEFPVLAYETCADVFSATGEAVLARHAVGVGYGELILRAGRISLPEWRQSFLENVPEHRRIRERWQSISGME